MQLDIFNLLYPTYKISKPIRLIELFGGYGSQHFALEYLGANFEHWKLVEWAVKSIQAYKDAHYGNDNTDYSKELSKDELIDYLYNKHISMDYNKPMKLDQIKRKDETWLRTVYNNIQATKNIVDITNTKGSDLEIVDTDKYEYIMTYSFPCQDLSLAGKRAGMGKGTRSGLLWEVERLLNEVEELPQILLMENVPQVIGKDNVEHFNKWQLKLESLGYKNYHQNLIATDYGIPQTRNRTFMISILGDYNYNFPMPIPLKLKLKDLLEDEVDERYYLSDSFIKKITINKNTENYIEWERINGELEHLCRAYKEDKNSCTLHTKSNEIKILEAKDGDGVYINRPHQKRGCVQKDKIQTIKTSGEDVVVNSNIKNINDENETFSTLGTNCGSSTSAGGGVVTIGNYSPSGHNASRIIDENGLAPTVMENHGTITAVETNLRIRKLTPKECFRLMGVKDEDYERIAKNQSNSSLYHLAGDSIVINVLMAIFKELI